MTRPTVLHIACILLCAICLGSGVAHAQYLYLDANGDGAHTAADVLSPAGPTTIDVWLDTNSNRDGTDAVCSTGDGELTINSYEVILRATNGTMSWDSFTNLQADFGTSFGYATSATELYAGFGGGVILPPGTYRLATLQVSVAGGTPALEIAPSTPLGALYHTTFGSRCSGLESDNTLKLGSDWFDADGLLYGGVTNQHPVLAQPEDMEVDEGDVAEQGLAATDADGAPIQFSKVSGPSFVTVTTLDPGAGSATGRVTAAPTFLDAGVTSVTVGASDGFAQDQRTFQLRVLERSQLALTPIDDVTVESGSFMSLRADAFDPAVPAVTFALTAGPPYVYLVPLSGKAATLYISPVSGDVGPATVTVSATSGTTTVSESFEVTVAPPSPCLAGWCASERTFPALLFPDRVEPTDFNDDGILDLVVVYSANLSVLPGLGRGVFGRRIDTPTPSSNIWIEIVVADYDEDGVGDVIGTRYKNDTYDLVVFRGHADGRFDPEFVVASEYLSGEPILEDVSGDGHTDLILSRTSGVTVALGLGGGTYQQPYTVATVGNSLALADFNQDGKADLASSSGNTIRVQLGNGAGGFGIPLILDAGFFAQDLAAEDMNRDGRMDLVAVGSGSVSPGRAFLGNGNGTFATAPSAFWVPGYASAVSAGDLTGDGVPDVHARYWKPDGSSGSSVIAGAGDGTFLDRTDYSSGHSYGFTDVALADWDADGVKDVAGVGSNDPKVSVFLSRGYTSHSNRPPTIERPVRVDAPEGIFSYFEAFVDDPDLDVAQFDVDASALPPGGTLGVNRGTYVIGISWRPPFGSIGEYPVVFRASAGGQAVEATTTVRVTRGSRPPVANAGGPYGGVVGVPVQFNGSGSFDPDGDPLTYSWSYGDGSNGVGVTPSHVYATASRFTVFLIVSDGLSSAASVSTATIAEALLATASLHGSATVALMGGGSSSTCVQIEPVGRNFDPSSIDPLTLVMKSTGTGAVSEIRAIAEKSTQVEDTDKDGIEELSACFRREDLRQLLSFVTGRDTVSVQVQGRLGTGVLIRGQLALVVVGAGGPLSASLAPNPLNPRALLSFVTPREGSARVVVYDVSGRLVRTLVAEDHLPAGYHEVPIDGLNASGQRLASGVYFYRIDAAGGMARGRFAILK